MLGLRMIKLKTLQISFASITISFLLFFMPFESYSDNLDDWGVPEYQQMHPQNSSFISEFNFISANTQYQITNIRLNNQVAGGDAASGSFIKVYGAD